jgi:hypothetical protein
MGARIRSNIMEPREYSEAVRLFLGGSPKIFTKVVAAAAVTYVIFPPYRAEFPILSAPITYQRRAVRAGEKQAWAFVYDCSQAEADELFAKWLAESKDLELSDW